MNEQLSGLVWKASEALVDVALSPLPSDPGLAELVELLIRDALGCGMYGQRFQWSTQLRNSLQRLSEVGRVPVWGTNVRLSPRGALLANSTQVHAFEWDDQCLGAGLHAGSATVTTGLAVAEVVGGVSGRRLIEAVWAGSEVGVRVGLLLGDATGRRGFHIHGWTGAVASAVTASRLLGLDGDSTMSAMGIAASLGSGLQGAQYGADTKRLHAGRAAESGLLAALLASEGFVGMKGFLERPHGGIVSSLGGRDRPEEVADDLTRLGNKPLLPSVLAFKRVPCKIGVQAPYSMLKEVLDSQRLLGTEVVTVRVSVSPYVASSSGKPYSVRNGTVMGAQASIRYVLARLLRDGEIDPESFTATAVLDDSLQPYLDRILVEADDSREGAAPEIRWGASLEVQSGEGIFRRDSSEGIPGFPGSSTYQWVDQKLRANGVSTIGAGPFETLKSHLDELADLSDVRVLGEVMLSSRTTADSPHYARK